MQVVDYFQVAFTRLPQLTTSLLEQLFKNGHCGWSAPYVKDQPSSKALRFNRTLFWIIFFIWLIMIKHIGLQAKETYY